MAGCKPKRPKAAPVETRTWTGLERQAPSAVPGRRASDPRPGRRLARDGRRPALSARDTQDYAAFRQTPR
ncbi:MAG: hypothetical protein ACOY5Y_16265 [Pseudomonadota bacterium]